jgi:hypothetical protein
MDTHLLRTRFLEVLSPLSLDEDVEDEILEELLTQVTKYGMEEFFDSDREGLQEDRYDDLDAE